MRSYFYSHVDIVTALRKTSACGGRHKVITAEFVSWIAEIDDRKGYVALGFDSMLAYCIKVLDLSEDCAKKYIRVGRAARRFPLIFDGLADGFLSLSNVLLLTPHLVEANADNLLQAAMRKTREQVEEMLASKFPQSEELPLVEATPDSPCVRREGAPGPPVVSAPVGAQRVAPLARVQPIAPKRFALHCSIDDEARNDLSELQELLSHQFGAGDTGLVIAFALKAALHDVRKRKCGATDRPQANPRPTRSARHIPAHVRRAVRERDGGQCTFASEDGHRCESRKRLEYDHILEVARGGEAAVDNIRLRCRTHNRYAAEQAFGAEFMQRKIEEAQRVAAEQRAAAEARSAASLPHVREVVPYVMKLGFRQSEALEAAVATCVNMADAPLEDRVKRAFSWFRRGRTTDPSGARLRPAASTMVTCAPS